MSVSTTASPARTNTIVIANLGSTTNKVEVQGRDSDGKFVQVLELPLEPGRNVFCTLLEGQSVQVIPLK